MNKLHRTLLENALRHFKQALGDENVSLPNREVIELAFNLSQPKDFQMFETFGTQAALYGLDYATRVQAGESRIVLPNDNGSQCVAIVIPVDDAVPAALAVVAAAMFATADKRRFTNKFGETYCAVLPDDPAHALVEATGMPWVRVVENSRYGTPYVEPDRQPDNAAARRKQEFGLGMSLLPEGNTRLEVASWIEEQTKAENTINQPPITALPTDWAERGENIDRLRKNREIARRALGVV